MSVFLAGTKGKSDCLVAFEAGGPRLELHVKSSVASLFGRAIEAAARKEAEAFGATGRLSIEDDGALDYVVASRVEAALRAAGLVRAAPIDAHGKGSPPARAEASRDRPRRSRLYLPGNQGELPINAGLFGADCILLDLEDSVAEDRKAEARILVRRLLEGFSDFFGGSEIAVRVNSLSSPFAMDDLAEIVGARPHCIVLPKCESSSDIEAWDREVLRLESSAGMRAGSILFMPIVETAKGVANAADIASASARNVSLCFGGEDYRRDIRVARGPAEEEIQVARSLIVLAARAAGIEAQDTVFSDVDDLVGLEASARRARSLGFSGKGLIHPSQIGIVHRVFSPSAQEVAGARRVLESLAAAVAEGRGVASLDGAMIDAPVAERARRVLVLAGVLEEKSGRKGARDAI